MGESADGAVRGVRAEQVPERLEFDFEAAVPKIQQALITYLGGFPPSYGEVRLRFWDGERQHFNSDQPRGVDDLFEEIVDKVFPDSSNEFLDDGSKWSLMSKIFRDEKRIRQVLPEGYTATADFSIEARKRDAEFRKRPTPADRMIGIYRTGQGGRRTTLE